ncbi:tetratricopeptide repeat protein [Rickettsia endosymbiont of Halotydeus destructor]|uniref:tetratricopeptide repeat protein n=1 Tax=Rickettsia endosymbiont of Halotydeus destructor TaxID=2996754 RepID=UPI003BB100B8
MINNNIVNSAPNNPKLITFPEGKGVLANANTSRGLAKLSEIKELETQTLYHSIALVKNVKAAIEMASYLINYFSQRNNITFIQNIIAELFVHYNYDDFKGNKLLEKYEIQKLSEKTFIYKIGKNFYETKLIPKEKNKGDFYENKFLKMQAMSYAIYTAIKNNHIKTAEELIKESLKTADLDLSLFLAKSRPEYDESTIIISEIINLLEPESRIHPFQILKKHWQQNFYILGGFSHVLLSQKYYDEVIELLEPKLKDTTDEINEDIGDCYYNLGLAYYNKANYQLAKKYYLSALKHLPNDQDTILELYKVYLKIGEVEKAENSINNLPPGDIKSLLEISLNLPEVSAIKLKTINKNSLPKSLVPLIESLEYIAKFNESKFHGADKILAFKKLLKIYPTTTELLSAALYTEQFELAKEITQKLPKEEIFQNKLLYKFKILLGLEDNYETSQLVINNNLQGEEAANIINISSSVLISNGELAAVPKKVEDALQYDPNNENSLEIGIAAALLNNNSSRAKEYINQLSEEKQQEIIANYSRDNKAKNIAELIEQYDAKEIHTYYQRVKQQQLLEVSQKITNNQITTNWNINKQEVKKDDTIFIQKYKGLNCFAKIAETIKNKLDNNLIDSFTKAIEKGITYCKTSVNGVKFLQNKAVEVKIDGDMRLYTNILYKNSHGELLINFDHYGNHNEVENFANSHHLEVLGALDTL